MRAYFKQLLKNLDKLTGIRQYEKLCQTPKPKEEIKLLLDILCRVTDQFQYIPDDQKKHIIDDAVISDQEFIGLNAKFIAKSLNAKKEFYLGKEDDVVIHPDALTGEARQARIREYLAAINGMAMVTDSTNFKEDRYAHIKSIQPSDGQAYKPNEKTSYEIQRHMEYVKDNYDGSGNKLPTWIEESEYNKVYDEVCLPKDQLGEVEEVKE